MQWITSTAMFIAGALVANSLRPAWDDFASRFVSNQFRRVQTLSMDDSKIQLGLRAWGCLLAANLIGVGFLLNMFPVALGLTGLLLIAPRWLLVWMIRKRTTLLRDQMVGCTRALANSARAGQSLTQALESVAADTPQPLAAELQRIVGEYQLGRPLAEALLDAKSRIRLDSFSLFASSIVISLQRGGRVTEALERIGHSLQENQRIERKLDADTASGWRVVLILTAFPFLFLIGFSVLHPEGTWLMFQTLAGQILLLLILGLVVASVWWSRKILTIEL